MSLELRQALQKSLIFQNPEAQRHQLTELGSHGADFAIHTDLISVMHDMLQAQMRFVITALRDDHRFDGCLGPYNHNPAGKAMDFWFLTTANPTDYTDASAGLFAIDLNRLKSIKYVEAIGLGGSAQTAELEHLLGDMGFLDNGADHIHVQVR